jgi:hypothetical protein
LAGILKYGDHPSSGRPEPSSHSSHPFPNLQVVQGGQSQSALQNNGHPQTLSELRQQKQNRCEHASHVTW